MKNKYARIFFITLVFVLAVLIIDSIEEKLELVAKTFADGQQDREDGLTVQYNDFWFNLRPSNTEPLLRLNIEANSVEILENKK